MGDPTVSAMDQESKLKILGNDLVKRLRKTDPLIIIKEVRKIIDNYEDKLIYSGYPWHQRLRFLEQGILDHYSKILFLTTSGTPM